MNSRKNSDGSKRHFDVAMLATVHNATDDRIFHREAKTLAKAGLSVCVIAPAASSGWNDGVWIEALQRPRTRIRRFLQSFAVLRRALRHEIGVFIFHDAELFPIGVILRLFGKHVVYDCHENLPVQVLQKAWLPKLVRPLMGPLAWGLEWFGSRLLSGVLVARDAVLPRFPKHRRLSIRNFPTRTTVAASAGPPIELRKKIAVYSGVLSRLRGISEIVEAFRGLEMPDAELWLIGPFENEEFKQKTLASLPPNAKWLGFMDHLKAVEYYGSARIGISLLHPTPSHRNSQPVKIYEYLGAGLPVISSNLPELAPLLEGCGVMVDPFDIQQVRRALQDLLPDDASLARMSSIGRQRIETAYSWEIEGERLLHFCRGLLADSRSTPPRSQGQEIA
jgi:glycosyltransferase involved in cell wall biosynthesis